MIKSGKKILALACICAASMITFGCHKEKEYKLPRVYPGIPPYQKEAYWRTSEYLEKSLPNPKSAKKGLSSQIPIDGDVVHLETYYCYSKDVSKLGIGKFRALRQEGPIGYTHTVKFKKLQPSDLKVEEIHMNPLCLKDGEITVIEWDYGLDKKTDFRLIVQRKAQLGKKEMIVQELDVGADGTIDERLTFSPDEDYHTRPLAYEKAAG